MPDPVTGALDRREMLLLVVRLNGQIEMLRDERDALLAEVASVNARLQEMIARLDQLKR